MGLMRKGLKAFRIVSRRYPEKIQIFEVIGLDFKMEGAFRIIARFQITNPNIRNSGIYFASPSKAKTAKIKAKASLFRK